MVGQPPLAALSRAAIALLAMFACFAAPLAHAQDKNLTLPVAELERMLQSEPMRIVTAEISRPTAKGGVDITLKTEAAFGDRLPMRIKLRRAEPGAEAFNNVPRYDIAAYELQKLLMNESEYVVPPTALRMMSLAELKPFAPKAKRTFEGADEVLCVLQYWLQDVTAPRDVLDQARLASDARYARHIAQLNVFTYLIRHGDSNQGNFLISAAPEDARVFAIDNGVAFASEPSNRGELWKPMRVERLPVDLVERIRGLTEDNLDARLGVLAQWELEDGRYVAMPLGTNLAPNDGVRRKGAIVQLGLTRSEINGVWSQTKRLLRMIESGKVVAY